RPAYTCWYQPESCLPAYLPELAGSSSGVPLAFIGAGRLLQASLSVFPSLSRRAQLPAACVLPSGFCRMVPKQSPTSTLYFESLLNRTLCAFQLVSFMPCPRSVVSDGPTVNTS